MSAERKGRLKIYLGYAAGVGKTYRMLDEAQALRAGGADIVIAYFEAHGRRDTIAKTEGFETVPRRVVSYGGSQFEEMDTEAVLRRRPAVALVDEFAHTNVPGAGREKRWQDVRVAGRRHRRPHHHERSAPGEPQRPGLARHRRAGAGNRAGLGGGRGRGSGLRGPHAAGLAQPHRARRGLCAGKSAPRHG